MSSLSRRELAHRLATFPRQPLARLPTPLEPMPRLAQAAEAQSVVLKADHATGLVFGGNKVRQLEFVLGEARARSADTVLITGAVQSNYMCAAAAAAARLGLACHVQMERRVPRDDDLYRSSGNALLDRLFGARVHEYPVGEDEAGADTALEELAQQLLRSGRRPYVIRLAPGPPPVGALGYVAAALELAAQGVFEDSPSIDEIVVGSGSGHTHAGLLVGLRALGVSTAVCGVCVRRAAVEQKERILARCREVEELLALSPCVELEDVVVDDRALAPGYGRLNASVLEAMQLAARSEGVLVDPVYTGKVLAGLIGRSRAEPGRSYLFVHTGGLPALFAYGDEILGAAYAG